MDKNIKNILLSELSNINYAKIILFGSRARGNQREDSDYDILVILNDELTIVQTRKIECQIRKVFALKLIDVDILVRTKDIINKYINVSGTVIYEAMKEGVLI